MRSEFYMTRAGIESEKRMPDNLELHEALEFAHDFMQKFSMVHLCGSLALYLHGFKDLRTKYFKDIDFNVTDVMPVIEKDFQVYDDGTSGTDFDNTVVISGNKNIKLEFATNPASRFTEIQLNGKVYRVALLEEIVAWKKYYANKGVKKHENDLIRMGILEPKIEDDDILPF